ncbi:MAG: protein-L-isoaspartate(D-aspartate) O-methyltransferase, partial [Planctomycetota bacterium]
DGELVRQPLRPTLFVPMTGTAEAKRVRLPDATQPQLINGSFEVASAADDPEGFIPGWYYGRQVMRVAIGDGRHVARFSNETPGLSSHLLQGIAIDGQAVSMIRFSGRVRTQSIEKGPDADAIPAIAISYYDEQRRMLQTVTLGPYRGTRDWREDSRLLRVPPTTKEAIIRLGLFGATGVAEFDNIRLQVLP